MFSKIYFRITIRVSKGLDPDQDRCFVGPGLASNRLPKAISGRQFPASMERLENVCVCV